MTPWEELANAIIIQACKDYRTVLLGIKLYPQTSCVKSLEELERFFRSEWFTVLTKVDGKRLMKKIKGEINASFNNSTNTQPGGNNLTDSINML